MDMKLIHSVTIQQLTPVSDGGGGFTEDWVDYKTVNAFVQPVTGKEYYEGQQLTEKIDYKVYTHYQSDIKADMRVIFNQKVLSIKSVLSLAEMGKYLVLMCKSE